MTLEDHFAGRMAALPGNPPTSLGVAVSGGGDSTALMHLAAGWARDRGVRLHIATVDHGLRTGSAAEARGVAAAADALGLSHTVLRWTGWDHRGNLQDAARRARRQLLWDWSLGKVDHILMGHTMDDQAETVLRNLARGSGVAGLSGMAELSRLTPPETAAQPSPATAPAAALPWHAPWLFRPLLGIRRAALRDWLSARGIDWCEDPSNDDPRFDRVRARQALATGAALGLTVEGLAATAGRMARAREALDRRAAEAAPGLSRVERGDVLFDRAGLRALDAETRLHLIAQALRWVASAEHRPRTAPLEQVSADALDGRAGTLHGCTIAPEAAGIRIAREPKAVASLRTRADRGAIWDRRWRLDSDGFAEMEIGAVMPETIADMDDWPATAPRRRRLAGYPAIFHGARLVALPGIWGPPCTITLAPPLGGFPDSLTLVMLSH
ncbi:tRNA lysidine(34) synthetase TilS [Tropicimonas sp. IMCC34043]|uniref:tRNA lysidine(34) synthetase TilS n=1 Tax=Tropicimonas sp. IMCC34043 TaxID=2248760 RepID=UPI001E519E48|nr:tRNA lysidine(34) synthetase TilS [Tropicimonas sp. IMCC34043]